MKTIGRVSPALIVLAFASAPLHALPDDLPPGVDPASGYRIDHYRAPTPDRLPGGTVLGDRGAALAVKAGTRILIDVMAEGVATDPLTDSLVVTKQRRTIPGAVWLPGVGLGRPDPATERSYGQALEALTGGDKGKGLMIFCIADCWHSWNAARRAVLAGYTDVAWYPHGTDGWLEMGLPLAPAAPDPMSGYRP